MTKVLIDTKSKEKLSLTIRKLKMSWKFIPNLMQLLFFAFFLNLSFSTVEIETLFCQRVNSQRVTCSLKQSKYYNSVEELKGVYPKVLKASVTEYKFRDSEGGLVDLTYVTTLLTSSGNVNLNNGNSDTAIKINNFLDDPTSDSLTVRGLG